MVVRLDCSSQSPNKVTVLKMTDNTHTHTHTHTHNFLQSMDLPDLQEAIATSYIQTFTESLFSLLEIVPYPPAATTISHSMQAILFESNY